MKWMLMMIMLLACYSSQAEGVYRWVDEDGHVHYGDRPVEDAEPVKIIAAPASGVNDTALPYETRRAMEHFPVTLYTAEKCGDVCELAHAFLKLQHVPYTSKLVKTQAEFDALKQESGSDMVPVLSIGRHWIKGYQPEQWKSELDAVGYPK